MLMLCMQFLSVLLLAAHPGLLNMKLIDKYMVNLVPIHLIPLPAISTPGYV